MAVVGVSDMLAIEHHKAQAEEVEDGPAVGDDAIHDELGATLDVEVGALGKKEGGREGGGGGRRRRFVNGGYYS